MTDYTRSTRRHVLRMGAVATAGLLVPHRDALALDTPGKLGAPLGPYGERSPFEKAVRWRRDSKTPETGSSFSPLQDSVGTITPSSLHYERHHSGIPTIDPSQHRLVIHGMVDRPLSLSMEEIRRLPSLTRTLVLECGGNSGSEWADTTGADVQRYKVEPYAVAADVYGEPPHEGRGGWTWYTGSSGWLYRAALEWILGFRLRENQATLTPCVPADWPGFTIRYRHQGTPYVISVERQIPGGVMQMTIDGKVQKPGRNVIDFVTDGTEHSVHVTWLAANASEDRAVTQGA